MNSKDEIVDVEMYKDLKAKELAGDRIMADLQPLEPEPQIIRD